MPDINIYTNKKRADSIDDVFGGSKNYDAMKRFAAKELSVKDFILPSKDVSVRIIVPYKSSQIADTEIVIMAYDFPERKAREDDICDKFEEFIEKKCPAAGSVYTWLNLTELGHGEKYFKKAHVKSKPEKPDSPSLIEYGLSRGKLRQPMKMGYHEGMGYNAGTKK